MITTRQKGKGRVKTVVDFGMLNGQTVCRVRTVNGDRANAVRRSNAETSIRQLLERTLRMRLTDRPFSKMFTFTIEPRSIHGRVGEESGTMWTEYTVHPGCVSMVLDTAMEIYRHILYIRMLKPSELAAAHSFPADYLLTGNRGQQIKQIGNSVPVQTAAAMCESALKQLAYGRAA